MKELEPAELGPKELELQQLEAIAGLATLENRHAPLIELLVRVARAWPETKPRSWLLALAHNAYGLHGRPEKLTSKDAVEIELIECLHLLTLGTGAGMVLGRSASGVAGRTAVIGPHAWIEAMNRTLQALETSRRNQHPHPLETVSLEVLEFVKGEFFGRALNVAERAALRGLYERQKNLCAT
jgi:hypothetical protein